MVRAGDRVALTVWRGEVREVTGDRYKWRENVAGAGGVAAVAAACVLAAGYPGAQVLMRLRGRRLPLCSLHPTSLLTSPVALAWGAGGHWSRPASSRGPGARPAS